jgi:hypothetical protein
MDQGVVPKTAKQKFSSVKNAKERSSIRILYFLLPSLLFCHFPEAKRHTYCNERVSG